MKFFLKVKPGAKINKVELTEECVLLVSVKAPAKEGKANLAVVRALADYFKIPKNAVRVKSGLKSKNKIVEISKN
ncbi:MAG: DUF167 domain-containing protein [Patescibacteria group bacterium]